MSLIGKNIKKIRTVKKLSQARFAELFSISRASIGSYEEERAEPKIDNIIEIANYFSIDLNLILKKELTVNEISGFELTDNKMLSGFENNLIKKKSEDSKRINYISDTSIKSFINLILNNEKWVGKTIELPPSLDKETSIAFSHNDNAMILNNEGIAMSDIVFGQKTDVEQVFNGYTYIVVSIDSIYLRKVTVEKDIILLNAVNVNFQPLIIKKKDVVALYKINAVIKRTINHFIS